MKVLIFGFSVTAENNGYVERCAALCPEHEISKIAIGGMQPYHARHLISDIVRKHQPEVLIVEQSTAAYRLRPGDQRSIDDHTATMGQLFHFCKQFGMKTGILDLPLVGVDEDADWLLRCHEGLSQQYNVPQVVVPLDENLLRDTVHPNEEGKDQYAVALHKLLLNVVESKPDFSSLNATRGFEALAVDTLNVSGGEYSEFSRSGLTVNVLMIPEGETYTITLPGKLKVVGLVMTMGPKSGDFRLDYGTSQASMHCYDRHCYYERLNGKPLTAVETSEFTIFQDNVLPEDELVKGEKDLGPRRGGVAYILYETVIDQMTDEMTTGSIN